MKITVSQNADINQLMAEAKAAGIQTVNVHFNVSAYETKNDCPPEIDLLCQLLKKLPSPRINNLILKAMVASCRMFETKKEAAVFLGVSAETIYEYVSKGKPFQFACRGGGHKQIGDGSQSDTELDSQ